MTSNSVSFDDVHLCRIGKSYYRMVALVWKVNDQIGHDFYFCRCRKEARVDELCATFVQCLSVRHLCVQHCVSWSKTLIRVLRQAQDRQFTLSLCVEVIDLSPAQYLAKQEVSILSRSEWARREQDRAKTLIYLQTFKCPKKSSREFKRRRREPKWQHSANI